MNFTFPMWSNGQKRLLGEVLRALPREIEWRMKWFDGSVKMDQELPPKNKPIDLALSSVELGRLADSLEDLNEIVLVGTLGNLKLQLESQDSTQWVCSCPVELSDRAERWFEVFSPIQSR